MNRAPRLIALTLVGAALLSTGCTFVKLTPEAQETRVVPADRVADCERLGSTTASMAERIGFLKRPPERIEQELEHAARNAAADMGGDTVVPRDEIIDGRRTYDVYRCLQ
ncbi:DUF4156 domain-containing protein [Ectothiorhodospira variabilis]|uniref:DUF4156 domain-containing protein n=1 Tax=Ectothiorhodospira variabilis TaxID=505694 RepID=UPI001EFAFEC9|nr:DUF4156 domain-containing protein [Ectothiorhodospira variabilis]MCG5495668.1 DUF4156 domain-containing protein [Ectothiorhodospira variabilis]MCG5504729.1 DUF4156 domain-containing protein [Ectothiorhodospira variabilis]MCG5507886.1 DUF4156 domain-containing protein [Ectothiorhodospira variabilis]